MGTAYGSTVQHWRAKVVSDITSSTDTTVTLRVRAYWCSISWGYAVSGNTGTATNGSYSTSATFTASSSTGQSREILVATRTVTYNKGSSAKSITCKATIKQVDYHAGTSTATTTHTIPAITYSTPNAPSSCSATRNSDSKATVTWTNGSTSTTRPRTKVLVERAWGPGTETFGQIASLSSSSTSYTDSTIAANRRYRYRVRSYGNGGYSSYSTSGWIYTTPGAPSSLTASVVEGTSIKVTVSGLGNYAEGWQLARSTDGGSTWTTIQSALGTSSLSYTDTYSGAVQYRARCYRGSLYSSWTTSNSVTSITQPLAPTLTVSPTIVAWGEPVTLSWVPNHPDASEVTESVLTLVLGDVDTFRQVTTETITITGNTCEYTYTPEQTGELADVAGLMAVATVTTKGAHEDASPASSQAWFYAYEPPTCYFTSPSVDEEEVTATPINLTWEADSSIGSISSQTLTLHDNEGVTLWSTELAGDVRSYNFSYSDYPISNLTRYCFDLTVTASTTLQTRCDRWFTTNWTPPNPPQLFISEGDGYSWEVMFQTGQNQVTAEAEGEDDTGDTVEATPSELDAFIRVGYLPDEDISEMGVGYDFDHATPLDGVQLRLYRQSDGRVFQITTGNTAGVEGVDAPGWAWVPEARQASGSANQVLQIESVTYTRNRQVNSLLQALVGTTITLSSGSNGTMSYGREARLTTGSTAKTTVPEGWEISEVAGVFNILFSSFGIDMEEEVDPAPEPAYFILTRSIPGESLLSLEDQGFDGQTVIDRLPPLNTPVTYSVVAVAENGAVSSAAMQTVLFETLDSVYNFGNSAETFVIASLNQEFSETPSISGEAYHFAGSSDSLPEFYQTGDLDIALSHSFVLLDVQEYARMRAIYKQTAWGWYRCVLGHRHRAQMTLSFNTGYNSSAVEVSVDMAEIAFREPFMGETDPDEETPEEPDVGEDEGEEEG